MGSANYQLQQNNLEDELNCALWLKNISDDCTPADIFSRINVGAVSILHIYPSTDDHTQKAAKLVFMKATSAVAFYASK